MASHDLGIRAKNRKTAQEWWYNFHHFRSPKLDHTISISWRMTAVYGKFSEAIQGPSHKLLFAEVNNLQFDIPAPTFETQTRQLMILMGFCCSQGQILVFQRKAPSGALGFHEKRASSCGTRQLCQIGGEMSVDRGSWCQNAPK